MIIWVNGPFGVGKTTVADELALLMSTGAIVMDPERLGALIREWTPGDADVDDFQDLQSWRRMTRAGLAGLQTDFQRDVIVPMTLLNPEYFTDIIGWLRAHGSDVRHFCLVADKATVTGRAERRRDGTLPWVSANYDRYAARLDDPRLREFLDARDRDPRALATAILDRLN